ncbi:MAG: hypothetical protein OER43_10185 [Gammaproteobacteria bacterium]|nr:hypothetical protein [Gammaproteobacteria bacterium]MDH3414158.1 hypothetical protein [Gammaproteobacteria bacterium]
MAFSVKERLMAIQRALDVDDDGILGPVTLTAIERVVTKRQDDRAHPSFSLIASRDGLKQLIEFEISSPQFYYRNLKKPIWPGGKSGITIGIGYDLGYHRRWQIEQDWRGHIPDSDIERLVGVVGLRGEDAKRALRRVRSVSIPFESARRIFYESSLPRYAKDTRRIYPGVQRLPADAQAMLLSLVYNRGTALSGSRRREMKAIKGHVRRKKLDRIADEIRRMKRLWDENLLPGLHTRRDAEADLVVGAERAYQWSELIYL